MTLDELKKGERARITALKCKEPLRRRLLELGLTPRCEVTALGSAPFGDPLALRARSCELTLRRGDARAIEVERL